MDRFSSSYSKKTAPEELFLGRQWVEFTFAEKVATLLLLSTPLFFLSIRHWVTSLSVLGCIAASLAMYGRRREVQIFNVPWIFAISAAFFAYAIAIFVSQLFRWSFEYHAYLDQTRWILGLPVFLFAYWCRLNFVKALDFLAPACVIFGYLSSTYVIPSDAWGERATVSFMDPLSFGFMSLSIGLLCFASFVFDIKKGAYNFLSLLKIIGFLTGIYLSVRSGSRSGWIALPFILFLVSQSAFQFSVRKFLLISVSISIFTLAMYFFNTTVNSRVDEAFEELIQYPWGGGMAADNSVGLRVTFYRLGWHYFSQNPLFGWGERGYGVIKDSPELILFSTQFARDFAFSALFHSEWTTQAVRYGVLGFVTVGIVFFVPGALFLRSAFFGRQQERKGACMGLAFLTCQLAASIGTEVFNSKAMITFTVFVLAGLLATLARLRERPP